MFKQPFTLATLLIAAVLPVMPSSVMAQPKLTNVTALQPKPVSTSQAARLSLPRIALAADLKGTMTRTVSGTDFLPRQSSTIAQRQPITTDGFGNNQVTLFRISF